MPLPPNCPVSLEYVPCGECNPFVVTWDDTHGGEWRVQFDSYGAATERFIRQVRRWREQQGDVNREDLVRAQDRTCHAPSK